MTVFFFFTVSHKGSISAFQKARPRLFCSYSAADVRHSTADVVKHSVAANVRHSTADVVKHSAAAECQTFNCRRMSGGFTLFHKRPDISAHSDCSKQPHSENVGDEVFPKLRIPKQLGHYGHAFEDC